MFFKNKRASKIFQLFRVTLVWTIYTAGQLISNVALFSRSLFAEIFLFLIHHFDFPVKLHNFCDGIFKIVYLYLYYRLLIFRLLGGSGHFFITPSSYPRVLVYVHVNVNVNVFTGTSGLFIIPHSLTIGIWFIESSKQGRKSNLIYFILRLYRSVFYTGDEKAIFEATFFFKYTLLTKTA